MGANAFSVSRAEAIFSPQLFKSAIEPSKIGLTNVGRALQKHVSHGDAAFADIKFSRQTVNQTGIDVFNEIIKSGN